MQRFQNFSLEFLLRLRTKNWSKHSTYQYYERSFQSPLESEQDSLVYVSSKWLSFFLNIFPSLLSSVVSIPSIEPSLSVPPSISGLSLASFLDFNQFSPKGLSLSSLVVSHSPPSSPVKGILSLNPSSTKVPPLSLEYLLSGPSLSSRILTETLPSLSTLLNQSQSNPSDPETLSLNDLKRADKPHLPFQSTSCTKPGPISNCITSNVHNSKSRNIASPTPPSDFALALFVPFRLQSKFQNSLVINDDFYVQLWKSCSPALLDSTSSVLSQTFYPEIKTDIFSFHHHRPPKVKGTFKNSKDPLALLPLCVFDFISPSPDDVAEASRIRKGLPNGSSLVHSE